ncbi:MAG: hypothetical protein V3U83_03680 [Acidobacteriota bacterium]
MKRKSPRTSDRYSLIIGPVAAMLGGFLTALQVATPAFAADPEAIIRDVIYESDEVRIYRTVRPDGQSAIVLTNLDAEGRRMGGEIPAPDRRPTPIERRTVENLPSPPADPAYPTYDDALAASSDSGEGGVAPAPDIQVIVNRGDGSQDAIQQDAVRVTPSAGGTTVIINIDAVAPQRSAPLPVMFAPIVAFGGLRGPIRYPEHHHFLGYGHNNSTPGLFGGLGLNASNGYGIGNPACGNGFDCMFGPQTEHP